MVRNAEEISGLQKVIYENSISIYSSNISNDWLIKATGIVSPLELSRTKDTAKSVHFAEIESNESENNGSNVGLPQNDETTEKEVSIVVKNEVQLPIIVHNMANESVEGSADSTPLNEENDEDRLAAHASRSKSQRYIIILYCDFLDFI